MLSRRFLRIKALKALYSYYTIQDETLIETRNKMLHSISKSYDLYYLLLRLVVEVSDYASEHIEIIKSKHLVTDEEKNPNLKFVNNSFIELIRNSDVINNYTSKNLISWGDNKELFIQLYNTMTSREYYKKYMASSDTSFESERDVVLKFYKKEIEDNELLMSVTEDISLYWIDEVEFIGSKVISTFVKWTEEEQPLFDKYIDRDDEQYVKDLLTYSISNFDKTIDVIKKYSKNWDSDRVTIMDKVILSMTTSEFLEFPSIPINVSLDEYIEISKYYSTSNSSVYINGLLDKVLTDLRREDKINKTGRGLQ